ncbi:MAG: hypothetical protein QM784_22090 [Polyangiaceae bacterium]
MSPAHTTANAPSDASASNLAKPVTTQASPAPLTSATAPSSPKAVAVDGTTTQGACDAAPGTQVQIGYEPSLAFLAQERNTPANRLHQLLKETFPDSNYQLVYKSYFRDDLPSSVASGKLDMAVLELGPRSSPQDGGQLSLPSQPAGIKVVTIPAGYTVMAGQSQPDDGLAEHVPPWLLLSFALLLTLIASAFLLSVVAYVLNLRPPTPDRWSRAVVTLVDPTLSRWTRAWNWMFTTTTGAMITGIWCLAGVCLLFLLTSSRAYAALSNTKSDAIEKIDSNLEPKREIYEFRSNAWVKCRRTETCLRDYANDELRALLLGDRETLCWYADSDEARSAPRVSPRRRHPTHLRRHPSRPSLGRKGHDELRLRATRNRPRPLARRGPSLRALLCFRKVTMTIRESLSVSLTLTADGTSATSDGGNVKELRLDLHCYGFEALLRMWVIAEDDADAFLPLVTSNGVLEAELTLGKSLYNVAPAPDPLVVSGIVTARKIREVTGEGMNGDPILYREYELEFRDPAQALWSHHRPSTVYAKARLDTIVEENTPSKIVVTSAWTQGKRVRPMVCLGLGIDWASFYDWLFWIADCEYGHIWYDYTNKKLVLDSQKPRNGSPVELAFGSITKTTSYRVAFAPPVREAVTLLNSFQGTTAKWDVQQPNAVTGVRRDYLVHTSLDEAAKHRQETEQNRHLTGNFDVRVDCDAYPEMYLAPGTQLTLAGEFGTKLFVSGKTLRVTELAIRCLATHQQPEYDLENEWTEYELDYVIELEAVEDPRWRGPRYVTPHYPVRVEGKIVSSVGSGTDRAYTVYADEDTGDTYKINLPLWNCTITIPMTPDFVPGHLYLPAYKDARVFVSMDFDSARIERFLDWGTDVTLPGASLGNHLLLGKNDASETSIKHWYVDNSPELVIRRIHSGDLGTVTVKEGILTLELTEEGGGSGFAATTSVEPQAQMAKSDSEQKSDLAVSDLQDATSTAQTQLTTEVNRAANAVKQQAEDLGADRLPGQGRRRRTQRCRNHHRHPSRRGQDDPERCPSAVGRFAEVVAMQALTEARTTLEDCARAAQAPLASLEQETRTLIAQIQPLPQKLTADTRKLTLRTSSLAKELDVRLARARSRLPKSPEVARAAAAQSLTSMTEAARTLSGSVSAAADSFGALVDGLDATVGTINDQLTTIRNGIAAARQAVKGILDGALALLKDVENKLDKLKTTLLAQLDGLEATFNATIDTIKTTVNTFIDGIRTVIGQFTEAVKTATTPITTGADALSDLVSDLLTKATTLVDQIQSLVSTVLGAIDKIPVAALPEPMAKPTVTAITQVATQFGTQLSTGASAAASQLQTLAGQLSTAIEQGQTQLSQQLETALKPMFDQIDKLVTQIDDKQRELSTQITAQLQTLATQKDQLIATAQTQIDALTQPFLDGLSGYCDSITQAASSAEQSQRQIFAQCQTQVATLQSKMTALSTRLETSVSGFETQYRALLAKAAAL